MTTNNTILFIIEFFVGLIFTKALILIGKKFELVDKSDKRKIHKASIVRIGGLSFALLNLIFIPIVVPAFSYKISLLLIGSTLILMAGLFDDLFDLKPIWKLLLDIVITALVVIIGNLDITVINLPFGIVINFPKWLSILLTVIWIIAIINAINLIDGLDGLAAGVSLIIFSTIFIIAAIKNDYLIAMICFTYIISLWSFLIYNFNPARIFMGDSGARYLGFSIATISILGFKNTTIISSIIPIVVLIIPIFDMVWSIIRRKLTNQKTSVADNNHLHHKIFYHYKNQKITVYIIYAITLLSSVGSVLYLFSKKIAFIYLIILYISVIILFIKLNVFKYRGNFEK